MKRFIVLMVIVLAAAGVWTGGWHYVAGIIEDEIGALALADGETMPRLHCETLEIEGFPFQFAPRCANVSITAGDYDIAVGEIQGTALFYRPTHIQLFAQGPMRIQDAFTGSIQDISWTDMRGSVRIEDNRIGRISLVSSDLVYGDGLFGDVVFGTAQSAELHLVDATETEGAPETGATIDYFMRLSGVQSGPAEIEDGIVTLDGRITGVPELDLLGHPQALAFWQANDGRLDIRSVDASAAGLTLNASGDIGLTPSGQVDGTLELSANGVLERFGEVAEDPVMAVLAGTPDAEGTYAQTISVRGGMVMVGIIPVFSLPALF